MATNTSTAASQPASGVEHRQQRQHDGRAEAARAGRRRRPADPAADRRGLDLRPRGADQGAAHLGRDRRGVDGHIRPDRPLGGGSRTQSAGRSAMAAIRDAALELAESAQTMALDALDATQKRAADALEATQKRATDALDAAQKRAAAAADSVTESVADAWKKVRDQAGPVVEKIKPQIDAATAYAKEDPARAALGLAAAGAIIAGLIALARRAQSDDQELPAEAPARPAPASGGISSECPPKRGRRSAHVRSQRLVRRLHQRRAQGRAARPDDLRPAHGLLSRRRRRRLGARGLLPASRRAALARQRARGRPHRLRLPRPGDGRRRPLRLDAGAARAADDQVVPDRRALRLRLGLAGREERRRSGAAASPALGREPRVGVRRRPVPRQVRLPADDRQPDGPDARDLRARDQHRPARDRGSGAGRRASRATRRSPAAS